MHESFFLKHSVLLAPLSTISIFPSIPLFKILSSSSFNLCITHSEKYIPATFYFWSVRNCLVTTVIISGCSSTTGQEYFDPPNFQHNIKLYKWHGNVRKQVELIKATQDANEDKQNKKMKLKRSLENPIPARSAQRAAVLCLWCSICGSDTWHSGKYNHDIQYT